MTPRLTPSARRDRRGQGTLVLMAVVATVVLAIVGLQQHFFSSHLTNQAARVGAGSTAVALAESALQEALWKFETQVNDRSSPLFELLRREVLAPADGAIDLTKELALEETPGLLASSEYKGYRLEKYEARVVYQRQFEDLPCERFGLVRFTARVATRSSLGLTVAREVEMAHGFKVVLATVPRPFDQLALYVGEAGGLTDAGQVNARRRRYLDLALEVASLLESAKTSAPAEMVKDYERALAAIGTRERLEKACPPFKCEGDAQLLAVWRPEQFFPLENLDVKAALDKDETKLSGKLESVKSAKAAAMTSGAGVEEHRELLEAADAALSALQRPMGRIWAFHAGFRVLGTSDKGASAVAASVARLHLDHWRRVAFHHLREGTGRGTAAEQLARLRARHQPLNGVVLVETNEPLRLSGDIKGKLVLVVHGPGVILEGTNKGDRESDLLTVVSLNGSVTLEGEVHACVVAAAANEGAQPGRVTMQSGSVLRGGLIMERPSPASKLEGRVYRVAKYFSGTTGYGKLQKPRLDHYFVGVSPTITYRKVTRS